MDTELGVFMVSCRLGVLLIAMMHRGVIKDEYGNDGSSKGVTLV